MNQLDRINDELLAGNVDQPTEPATNQKEKRKRTPKQVAALEKARATKLAKQRAKKAADQGASEIINTIQEGGDADMAATTKSKIYTLLPKITAEIGAIRKAQQNSHQRYQYRGIDDALNQISPVLAKHGVCTEISVIDHVVQRYEGRKNVYHATLRLQVTFVASDGSSVKTQAAGEGISHGDDKATAKAMSGAMKYALYFGLMIPVDGNEIEDADRHEVVEPEVSRAFMAAKSAIEAGEDLNGLREKIKVSTHLSDDEKLELIQHLETKFNPQNI